MCALRRKTNPWVVECGRDADHSADGAEQALVAGISRPHNESFVDQVTNLSTPAHTEMTEPIQGLKEETEMTRKPPYYRLHIDLLRVSSALCLR